MEFGFNVWDLFTSLGNPSKFQRVSRLAFVTAAMSLTGGQPNFAWCLAISWAGILYIGLRFPELLPDRILPSAKFTLRPSLAFSYIGSITARHCSRWRHWIKELLQKVPPIFHRVAITLGIGPHSSCYYYSYWTTRGYASSRFANLWTGRLI